MSVNAFRPHVLVIPEDDANRQIATGFQLEVLHERRIQVLNEVGGWRHVTEHFLKTQQKTMTKFPERRIILLLDFDDQTDRRNTIEQMIPSEFRDRVFLLGVRSEPEKFPVEFGNFETIGRRLAIECRDKRQCLWQHELLRNNIAELNRLEESVRSFLFDP